MTAVQAALVTMTLALAPAAMAAQGRAFPSAAAQLYLRAADAEPASLGPVPRPSAAAVARAEATLRRLANGTAEGERARRQRALAAMVLGEGESRRGELDRAQADLARAAEYSPIRDAATAALVATMNPQSDAAGVLAAADRYPLATTDAFYRPVAQAAAAAAVERQQWAEALRWTAGLAHGSQTLWWQAQAEAGLGHAERAAELERELVYHFPASAETQQAAPLWQQSAAQFAGLAPDWKLVAAQARAWSAAGQAQRAAQTWLVAAAQAPAGEGPGLDAEAARAWVAAGQTPPAQALITQLATGPERPAMLELTVEIARRADDPEPAMAPPLAALAAEFPHSPWFARALHEAGDEALVNGNATRVQALFDRLARGFPDSAYAPAAAWRATWIAYRLRQPDTRQRLERFLARFPNSGDAADALYWRGEWASAHGEEALAQACFRTAARRFPGAYFGLEAAARLKSGFRHLTAIPAWLQPYQHRPSTPEVRPAPAVLQPELERAGWLDRAGLAQPAATIVRTAMLRVPPGEASLQIARAAAALELKADNAHGALVALQRAVPDYLALQPWQLTRQDWQALYPRPYRGDLALAARHFELSQDLLWGVARQESAFDPGSVSSARARGLMQLELATARAGLRRLPASWQRLAGPGPLSANDLLNPSLSLALGANELHALLSRFGTPAPALAGYNAGATRVVTWQQRFGEQDEPAFIESIPFSQTRLYIQAVLRNAAAYRRLYGK